MKVNLLGELWRARAALRRRHQQLPARAQWSEHQTRWVQQHAAGKSFAEVGGLFGANGTIAFLAEAAGATAVTEFDAGDPDLCGFADEHRRRGSRVQFVQGDLDDVDSARQIGRHDVVYCTGVIYHSPNPLRQLMNLREITGELLYLGTLTIPEVPGFPQACVYYPYLNTADRHPYKAGYGSGAGDLIGIGSPYNDAPMTGHANCWWGITVSALRSMLRTARFEVISQPPTYLSPYLTELVARPVDEYPVLPPPGYYHERQRRREDDKIRLPFRDYYEARAFEAHQVRYGMGPPSS